MPFESPARITPEHDVSRLQCQHAELTDWLQRRALANERAQVCRTYVVCEGLRVVGYYVLAAGALEHAVASGHIRRNMPAPIPAIVLGRLAVDERYQGQGFGAGLLQNAIYRSQNVVAAIGARVLLCHAIDERASTFYLKHGFLPSPFLDLTVMLDLRKLSALLTPPAPP